VYLREHTHMLIDDRGLYKILQYRDLYDFFIFFFKQKTAYEIGLGIPAEPLFRSRRLHARIRKTRYMHKMRCLLINRRSLLLALRLLWKTPIFPSNSRFPRLCAKCLLKLKRLVSILPMT